MEDLQDYLTYKEKRKEFYESKLSQGWREKPFEDLTDEEKVQYFYERRTSNCWNETPEVRKILNRIYYKNNQDKIKQYKEENKDKIKDYRQSYYKENKELIKEKSSKKYLCPHCNKHFTKETVNKHLKKSKSDNINQK